MGACALLCCARQCDTFRRHNMVGRVHQWGFRRHCARLSVLRPNSFFRGRLNAYCRLNRCGFANQTIGNRPARGIADVCVCSGLGWLVSVERIITLIISAAVKYGRFGYIKWHHIHFRHRRRLDHGSRGRGCRSHSGIRREAGGNRRSCLGHLQLDGVALLHSCGFWNHAFAHSGVDAADAAVDRRIGFGQIGQYFALGNHIGLRGLQRLLRRNLAAARHALAQQIGTDVFFAYGFRRTHGLAHRFGELGFRGLVADFLHFCQGTGAGAYQRRVVEADGFQFHRRLGCLHAGGFERGLELPIHIHHFQIRRRRVRLQLGLVGGRVLRLCQIGQRCFI